MRPLSGVNVLEAPVGVVFGVFVVEMCHLQGRARSIVWYENLTILR